MAVLLLHQLTSIALLWRIDTFCHSVQWCFTWSGFMAQGNHPVGSAPRRQYEKKVFLDFLSHINRTCSQTSTSMTMVLPLATFRAIGTPNPSAKLPRRICWQYWYLRWMCQLAACSRNHQHLRRCRHIHRQRWRKWVNIHPFLHLLTGLGVWSLLRDHFFI